MITESIAPTTLIQDRYYVLRVLRPLEFGWLYSVVDRGITPVQKRTEKPKLPLCFLEEFRVPENLIPHLDRLAEQLRLEIRQVQEAKALSRGLSGVISSEVPDYDEVIVSGDRLFLKQFYVDHFSYGQVLEDRALTGEGDVVLSESEAWELLDAIEPILKALHRQGLSHDNLSPETIVWQMAAQKPGLMHFGSIRSVIQRVSAPLHSLDFTASVLSCPMQTDWVNLAETTLVLLGDPDWNHLSLQLAQRLRHLLEASPQSQLPPLRKNLQTSPAANFGDPMGQGVGQGVGQNIRQPVRKQKTHRSRKQVRPGFSQRFSLAFSQHFRGYFKSLPSLRQDPMLWGMALLIFGLSGLLGYRILMAQARNPVATESLAQPPGKGSAAFPLSNPSSPDPNLSNPDISNPDITAPPALSNELKTQLRSLQVSDSWFATSVDEMLEQSGISPDDDRWKSNSKTLIQALEKLTPESRQNIGSYRRSDFDNWLAQAGAKSGATKSVSSKPISSKEVEAQTDEQFFALLPDRKGKAQNPRQLGQIWYSIARQVLKVTN